MSTPPQHVTQCRVIPRVPTSILFRAHLTAAHSSARSRPLSRPSDSSPQPRHLAPVCPAHLSALRGCTWARATAPARPATPRARCSEAPTRCCPPARPGRHPTHSARHLVYTGLPRGPARASCKAQGAPRSPNSRSRADKRHCRQ